jgi:hypothetical protein
MSELAALLDALEAFLRGYVICSEAQAVAIVLWVAHTYVLDAFDSTPYLNVKSAEPESGKTRLLEVLECLVYRPWRIVEASEAVIFRKIASQRPTILLDEADTIFERTKDASAQGLRCVLNAGYRRGAVVPRCTGKERDKLVDFPVFGAKAIAGISDLPTTVSSRSIPIRLLRRKKDETVKRFKERVAKAEAEPLRAALATWATADTIEALRSRTPTVPEALGDREAEVWEPLVAIAEMAGDAWSARARVAAVELQRGVPPVETDRLRLLRAMREVFGETSADRIATAEVLHQLVQREGEPWGARWGRAVSQAEKADPPETAARPASELADLLRDFGIGPTPVRVGEKTARGYKREHFSDAFARYLPSDVTPVTPPTAPSPAEKASPGNGCDDRNVCNGSSGGERQETIPGLDGEDRRREDFCFACGQEHGGACP